MHDAGAMDYKSAFITGASGGIGAELAKRLAANGVVVAISARRTPELEALAAQIDARGGKAHVYPLDVSDPEQTTEVIQRADDELGGLDLVVANAGVGRGRWGGKLTWADCAQVIDVNVIGAVATLTAVLPRMVGRKRGHLVGISSIAAFRGMPKTAAYCGSKAFLSNFLESLRIDLRKTGVAVTDVRPGFVRTPMLSQYAKLPPFTIELERAGTKIIRAIESRRAIATFPLPVAVMMRTASLLPSPIYTWLQGR